MTMLKDIIYRYKQLGLACMYKLHEVTLNHGNYLRVQGYQWCFCLDFFFAFSLYFLWCRRMTNTGVQCHLSLFVSGLVTHLWRIKSPWFKPLPRHVFSSGSFTRCRLGVIYEWTPEKTRVEKRFGVHGQSLWTILDTIGGTYTIIS
jgi:hypothetical protein